MTTLDELEEIKELVNNDKHFKYKNIVNFNCENIEKSLKALEIIKKNFEFGLFETDKYKVYIYSSDDDYSVVKIISKEEFNLLKEVLE